MAAPDRDREAVLDRLAALISAVRRPHVVRVAIDGVDAMGKTTLADELRPLLEARGRPVVRATIDGFHRPRAERHRRGPTSPEGYYHDSFDHDALRRELLEPLGPGGSRRYRSRVFDLRGDEPVRDAPVAAPGNAVLLFDGVFLFRPELNDLWDFRVFVEFDAEEALRRAVVRDEELFGSPDEALRRYRNRYVPGQRLYLDEVDPAAVADVIFENTDVLAPGLSRSIPPLS
jgi:uridine kinase